MKKAFLFTTGFALFAMFFGAGNLVFPIKMGHHAESGFAWAISGFMLTGVIAPILGFLSMMLYEGDWRKFFASIGKVPGFVLVSAILLVLGPCGALPRCIALTSSAVQTVFPTLTLEVFSLIACVIIFLLTFQENNVISVIGKFLTPFKLITLGILMMAGFMAKEMLSPSTESGATLFTSGLLDGLQTLDLPAALLFSAFLFPTIRDFAHRENTSVTKIAAKVALICGTLLAFVYIGFCYVAACQNDALSGIPTELLLIRLSEHLLGSWGSNFTMVLIVLACLTTEVALTAIFAEYLKKEIFKGKVRYEVCLAITLVWAYFFAIMSFNGIIKMLAPILVISYPALVCLCVANLAKQLWNFRMQKSAFIATLAVSIAYHSFS
jgi:branched-chain amino acid:cation transporter, LIVCS family